MKSIPNPVNFGFQQGLGHVVVMPNESRSNPDIVQHSGQWSQLQPLNCFFWWALQSKASSGADLCRVCRDEHPNNLRECRKCLLKSTRECWCLKQANSNPLVWWGNKLESASNALESEVKKLIFDAIDKEEIMLGEKHVGERIISPYQRTGCGVVEKWNG